MKKMMLGLSVGALGAVLCLLGFFSGYIVAGIGLAYAFLRGEKKWLDKLKLDSIVPDVW